MSLEAVQKVAQAEQQSKERKAAAAEQAKRLVAEARQNGQAELQKARATAESRAKEQMALAEERAAKAAETVLADTRKSCASLCQAAESKLADAAALIVRRVVNVECPS